MEESLQEFEDISMEAAAVSTELLPAKTKARYLKEYEAFMLWRKSKNVGSAINEDILLCYVAELTKTFSPNSVWSKISMLKTCLRINENIDISRYEEVFTLLKRNSKHYQPNKAKVLTSDEITKYLLEAPDDQFLLEKVITVFGIFGACRREELLTLRVNDIEDTNRVIIVTLKDTNNKSLRKFVITEDDTPFHGCTLYRKYAALRPPGLENQRVFVDYRNGKCTRQFVGIHKIGGIPRKIAEFLNLKNPETYTSHSFKRSAASMLAENGGAFMTLQGFGYRRSSMAEQYAEESDSKKIKISKKLNNSATTVSNSSTDFVELNSTEEFQSDHDLCEEEKFLVSDFADTSSSPLQQNTTVEEDIRQQVDDCPVIKLEPESDFFEPTDCEEDNTTTAATPIEQTADHVYSTASSTHNSILDMRNLNVEAVNNLASAINNLADAKKKEAEALHLLAKAKLLNAKIKYYKVYNKDLDDLDI